MNIIVQKGKEVFHFNGRVAQTVLALRARGIKGLSHIDFQMNFDGGYRLSASILELRQLGFFISDEWFKSKNNRRYKVYYLNDKIWIKVSKEQI